MSLTRDKVCSLVKKWQTLIEANTDVKTSEGYTVRLFCLAFTKRTQDQQKAACYAQSAHIGKEIEKQTRAIFPLKDVCLRKCKVLKKPKFDITRLMELHEKSHEGDSGAAMVRPETEEAQNLLTAEAPAEA